MWNLLIPCSILACQRGKENKKVWKVWSASVIHTKLEKKKAWSARISTTTENLYYFSPVLLRTTTNTQSEWQTELLWLQVQGTNPQKTYKLQHFNCLPPCDMQKTADKNKFQTSIFPLGTWKIKSRENKNKSQARHQFYVILQKRSDKWSTT